jgi:hypothetical protein
MLMTERMMEMEFLKRLIKLNQTQESRELGEKIARIQHDEHCVQRAIWLMAILTALAGTGFAYEAILRENLLHDESRFVLTLICTLALASLVSLIAFVALLLAYRKKSNLLRQECRRLITNLLESQLNLRPSPESDSGASEMEFKDEQEGSGYSAGFF